MNFVLAFQGWREAARIPACAEGSGLFQALGQA